MDFVANTDAQRREMLAAIGVSSFEELLAAIPQELRLPAPSTNDGLSEYEGFMLMQRLAEKNRFHTFESYLGAGAYEHHVPALVAAVCGKSEFLTAYTPYQAEASQGMLQSIFEFQSAVCALTAMDVANASVYDGAVACAEALLMALRHNKERRKVLVAENLHPHYRAVVQQYVAAHADIILLPFTDGGTIDSHRAFNTLKADVAALLIQSPNFFGTIEEAAPLIEQAHAHGIIAIIAANPLSYGLYSAAGELGADIAVGDCQPLGLPLQFGGPYVGYMACRSDLVRQLPGRLVGETIDSFGQRGFVLTLQAREQHIRREKATSNICTNQALAALASLVAILWYGKQGIADLALTNYQRSAYLKEKLAALPGIKVPTGANHFNEFVVEFPCSPDIVECHFYGHGIAPGIPLKQFYPQYANHWLVAVTETKNQEQLDRYMAVAAALGR
jgi:glycine dehydrogenase subunit 1